MKRMTFLALALLFASVAIAPAAAQGAGDTISRYRIPNVFDVRHPAGPPVATAFQPCARPCSGGCRENK